MDDIKKILEVIAGADDFDSTAFNSPLSFDIPENKKPAKSILCWLLTGFENLFRDPVRIQT